MHNRKRRQRLYAKLADYAGKALLLVILAYVLAWSFVNFMLGCGEVRYAQDGRPIAGECMPLFPTSRAQSPKGTS